MEEIGAYFALKNLYDSFQKGEIMREQCMAIKGAIYIDWSRVRRDKDQLKQLILSAQLCTFRAETLGVELIKRTEPGADLHELLMLAADCISHMRGEEESSMRKTLERRLRGEFSIAEMAARKKEQEEREASA